MTFQEFLKIANNLVADIEFYKPNGFVDTEITRRLHRASVRLSEEREGWSDKNIVEEVLAIRGFLY